MQRAVTDFGADHPFRKVSGKLEEHYGISLPHETARGITEGHGRALLENTVLETKWPSIMGEECVLVETDGGMVPIVQRNPASTDKRKGKTLEWKELKLCIARGLGCVTPVYGGTFSGDVSEAGKHLFHCACQAGLGKSTEVHAVGDGAKWIANQVEKQFGSQGSYLIDFYHLSEYLGEAAESCSTEPEQWLKAQQAALRHNLSVKVLETLLPYLESPELPDAKAPVRKAYRYLRNRSDQVDYRQAIEKERPIGSGEVESAHRYVVQERLKKAGAWWAPENVDPMLALRITRINGHWDAYWSQILTGQAAA